jgi:phosphoglycerol transferase MdoB-like AlkP superfamily enzyme
VAVHPFEGWFWNRSNVYQHLGFDRFLAQENLPALEKRGIFASDTALMKEVMRLGDEAEKPLFLFTVTLQGHGPYEANRYAHNRIPVEGALSEAAGQQLATYSEGVREADDSLAELMDWAKNRRRETIIVLFGDHLPPMGQVFLETEYMQDAVATRRASLETMLLEHETPLLVWSSKTGPKKNLGTISPALLSHHVVKAAGFSDPFYTGFLGDVAKDFSVIDRYMLVGKDGQSMTGWNDGGKKAPALLKDYRLLQYDMMFGEQFAKERFFPALRDAAPVASAPGPDEPVSLPMPG